MANLSAIDLVFMILGYCLQVYALAVKEQLVRYDPLVQDTYIHFLNVLAAAGYMTFAFTLFDAYMRTRNGSGWLANCMMFIFAIIFALLVIAGIGGIVLLHNTTSLLRVRLEDAVGIYGNDTSTSVAIDLVQREMKCCGIYNDTDWKNVNLYYGANGQRGLPVSCCEIPTSTFDHFFCNHTSLSLHKTGCLKAFGDYISSDANFILYVGFVAAAFQFLAILWTMWGLCSPRDGYEEM